MWSWKKKHSVCAECGVHFEPTPVHLARWGHLCAQHRAAAMDADRRKDRVTEWAAYNFERLEKIMLAEQAEKAEANRAGIQGMMNAGMQSLHGGSQEQALNAFNPFRRYGNYQ